MDKRTLQPRGEWSVSFRVICVGKELSGVYRSILSMGLDGVSVQSTTMFPNPAPSEEDGLVILLANGNSPLLNRIARSFYQAGVLTVVVSTEVIETKELTCDAQTVTSKETMAFIVKDLLNPLLKQGLLCYDFNDLYQSLHNAEKFKVLESSSRMTDHRIEDAIVKMSEKFGHVDFNQVENLSLIIFINKGLKQPLLTGEVLSLSEYLSKMSEEVCVIWTITYDDDMPTDEVKAVAILSGKNLEL